MRDVMELDLTDVEQYDCDEQFGETFTCRSCGSTLDIDLMFMGCCTACRRKS